MAFVGPSGCGKSTLLRLLFRFYDADKGKITVDGVDVRDLDVGDLRRGMWAVKQETPTLQFVHQAQISTMAI